jgi:hypothetical protein
VAHPKVLEKRARNRWGHNAMLPRSCKRNVPNALLCGTQPTVVGKCAVIIAQGDDDDQGVFATDETESSVS